MIPWTYFKKLGDTMFRKSWFPKPQNPAMFHGEVLPQGFAFVSFSGEESVQAAGNSTPTQTT